MDEFTITISKDTVELFYDIVKEKMWYAEDEEEYRVWNNVFYIIPYFTTDNFECLKEIYNDIQAKKLDNITTK